MAIWQSRASGRWKTLFRSSNRLPANKRVARRKYYAKPGLLAGFFLPTRPQATAGDRSKKYRSGGKYRHALSNASGLINLQILPIQESVGCDLVVSASLQRNEDGPIFSLSIQRMGQAGSGDLEFVRG
jgi:hypothetical protein